MLARSAERVYWGGRYLERTENTARIVQQYSQLFLDLPAEVGIGWSELIRVVGASTDFAARHDVADEKRVFEYLLADSGSPAALLTSLKMARDNIRNTRDLLPLEAWEAVNELYQFAKANLAAAVESEDRFEMLDECLGRCLQINGVFSGALSRATPFYVLRLGQSIERADMTSRIVDVAAAYLQANERVVARYGSTLWSNVLSSVSGFQMYRQFCQPQVEAQKVIEFLLNDRSFPRSVACCTDQARSLAAFLPASDKVLAALDDVDAAIADVPNVRGDAAAVSDVLDTVQSRLAAVHNAVAATWFLPSTAG